MDRPQSRAALPSAQPLLWAGNPNIYVFPAMTTARFARLTINVPRANPTISTKAAVVSYVTSAVQPARMKVLSNV
jgi:hypothetical protein